MIGVRHGLVIAALVAAAPRAAAAGKVTVKVVEVAGGVAYLTPGADAGLVAGTVVRIGKHDHVVVDATAAHAMIQPGDARLDVGDKGSAEVTPGAVAIARTLPPPPPLDRFRGQWRDAVRPATTQAPAPVPLGAAEPPGRLHAMGWAQALLAGSGQHATAALELGTRVSYELLADRPLAADVDAAIRLHSSGLDAGAHTPILVRTAQLRWGDPDDPRLAIGRLRWASATTGMLDGARVSARAGGFELAGFGGLEPDTLGGAPEPSASRFGVEAIYQAGGGWAPHLALSAQGSTWSGALDERRLAVDAEVHHGGLALDGFAEAQAFSAGNPWGAAALELTGAGATVDWRGHRGHLGLDASLLRPERSLRLDAALPADWLCVRAPAAPGSDEACQGGDLWAQVSGVAGAAAKRWTVDAGGSLGATHGGRRFVDGSGFVLGALRVLPRRGRLEVGASGGRASFLDWVAADVGVAASPARRLDLRLRVREEERRYRGALNPARVHLVLADVRWARRHDLDLGVAASAAFGGDTAVTVLTTIAWRPRP